MAIIPVVISVVSLILSITVHTGHDAADAGWLPP
jgi:hypothetical protein